MKALKNTLVALTITTFMTGLALNFTACSEQSPMQPGDNKADGSITTLAKKTKQSSTTQSSYTTSETQSSGNTCAYPQFALRQFNYEFKSSGYSGGNMNVPNGSTFHIISGALIPPPETPFGEPVTLTMLVEKDEIQNELIFTFGPSGTQFNTPAEVWFDWSCLGTNNATLYYIDENNNYIEQEPDDVDRQGKRMKLYIYYHFSRYAVAWSR